MAIQFSCSACGKRLRVKDEHAGRPSKCPACGWGVTVPLVSSELLEAGVGTGSAEGDVMPAGLDGSGEVAPPPLPSVEAALGSTGPAPAAAPGRYWKWERLRRTGADPVPLLPGAGFRAFLIILSAVFVWTGLGSTGGNGYREKSFDNRFTHEYAAGATANAVEYMAGHQRFPDIAQWLTLALLCWLIAGVDRLRIAVELAAKRSGLIGGAGRPESN